MNANELAEGINSPHNACCYRDKCRQQQAEIEELKAKLGCDPAYFDMPARKLTDEEILELGDKYLVSVQEYIGCGDYVSYVEGEIEFARAILRKAQEK